MGFQTFLSFAPFRAFALVDLIVHAQLLRSTGTACEAVSRRASFSYCLSRFGGAPTVLTGREVVNL